MWRLALLTTVAALLVTGASPAAAAPQDSRRSGRLLVKLRDQDRGWPATAASVAARAGARRTALDVPQIGLLTLRPRQADTAAALRRRLLADPRVARVEAESGARPRFQPNDPAWTTPETDAAPGTNLQWWAQRSKFPLAWDYSRGANTRVAIIDSGIDETHPDLARRVILSRSFDDPRTPPGTDEQGHGTHVASLACGAGDNRVGIAGAGMECRILNAKVRGFYDSAVAKAIVWATDERADVINMSFGSMSRTSRTVRDALRRAVRRGVVLVAAAADDDTQDQGYPANVLEPGGTAADLGEGLGLSVTAATFEDARASWVGSGPGISMAAYGVYDDDDEGPPGIFGAFPAGPTELEAGNLPIGQGPCVCRAALGTDTRYARLQGTSMAAAQVSGAAALVRSLNPDLSGRQVVRLLKQTARRPTGTRWSPDLGWGILDAGAAVAAARQLDERAPQSRIRDIPARRPAGTRLRVGYSYQDQAPPNVQRSPVRSVDIFMRVDRGRWRRLASVRPGRRPPAVMLQGGRRYDFSTSAVDRAGNRERRPRRPDQSVLAV